MQYALTLRRVIDGNTIEGDIELPYGIALIKRHFRLLDFDTWELDGDDDKGLIAKRALEDLFCQAHLCYIETGLTPFDSFGRLLARVYIILKSGHVVKVSDYMIQGGHARR